MNVIKIALLASACVAFGNVAATAQAKKAPAKKVTTTKKTTSLKTVTAPVAAGYKKTENGLEYKLIKVGTGALLKEGDMAEMHIVQKLDDSVMMDSRSQNNNNPIPVQINNSTAPGDLMAGFRKLKVGDHATFRVSLDSLMSYINQPRPEWTNSKKYAVWDVQVIKIKSPEEIALEQKQQQEKMATQQAASAQQAELQKATDDQLLQDYFKTNNITNTQKTASGLYYVIHKQGEGPMAPNGSKVSVNYTGINMKGEKFDSNVDPAFNHVQPLEFNLGTRMVIQGWDEGVALMNKGMKATFYIPSGLAYGAQSRGPNIPANAILIFDVELLDFK
jgi:FKBP-type peptidyl-prolyl cis-trans isomerase FkpA